MRFCIFNINSSFGSLIQPISGGFQRMDRIQRLQKNTATPLQLPNKDSEVNKLKSVAHLRSYSKMNAQLA